MSSAFDKSGGIDVYGNKVFTGDVTVAGVLYDSNGQIITGGGGGSGSATPVGPNTSVQFNKAGAFSGSANFTYTNGTSTLAVSNITGSTAKFTTISGSAISASMLYGDGSNLTNLPSSGGGLGTVYKTSSVNTTPVTLDFSSISANQIWSGDVMVTCYVNLTSSATPSTWEISVDNQDNISGPTFSIKVNGHTYNVFSYEPQPDGWIAAILTAETNITNINFSGAAPLIIGITSSAGATSATVTDLIMTGFPPNICTLTQTHYASAGGTTVTPASVKLHSCIYTSDGSNNVSGYNLSSSYFGGSELSAITASVYTAAGNLRVQLTGINGYTTNWAVYGIGQKVLP